MSPGYELDGKYYVIEAAIKKAISENIYFDLVPRGRLELPRPMNTIP